MHNIVRALGAFCLVVAFLVATGRDIRAATNGQIIGTVTDAVTKAPVAGAIVTAVSPSDRYTTKTDRRGQFALAGVTLETYVVSVEAPGYERFSLAGATVTGDEAFRLAVPLQTTLRTIGNVRVARSNGSAFQPGQTSATVTVTAAQIDQILGKSFNTDQRTLLERLPGVTVDKNNIPLIRGGQSFQTGFQYEGIDYTQPSQGLSNRFSNFANGNVLLGAQSLQIVAGGGDATRGNTGTGNVALTAKRGTFPASGRLDYEIGLLGGGHQFAGEYGTATNNNHFSNYLTFVAQDQVFQYGPYGTPADGIIADPTIINPSLQSLYTADQRRLFQTSVFNIANQSTRSFVDNLLLRFGKNNTQSLQYFVQDQVIHQDLDYGGYDRFLAVPRTVFYANNAIVQPPGFNGSRFSLSDLLADPSDVQRFYDRFTPGVVGATPGEPLAAPETIANSFNAFKVEYQNNFDGKKSAAVRWYRAFTDQHENLPSQGLDVPQNGGARTGTALDFTAILSAKHSLAIGGKYEFAAPFGARENSVDYTGAFAGVYRNLGAGIINIGPYTHDVFADFVQPANVGSRLIPGGGSVTTGTPACSGVTNVDGTPYRPVAFSIPQEHCGYLYRYFPGGLPGLPAEREIPTARQQSYGLYAQDTYTPNARVRVSAGIRLDGYNFLIPDDPLNPPAVDGVRHQRLYEPKLGVSYRLGDRDYVRANVGRTLEIPLPTFIGTNIDRSAFAAYANVPSYDSVTNRPATYCGPGQPLSVNASTYFIGNRPCSSYADQLYWLVRNARFQFQNQITSPLRGATFTNYDLSFGHEFRDQTSLRVTPFYRVGYDVTETTQTLLSIDQQTGTQLLSPPLQSNLGTQRATGVEFNATTRPVEYGLTAQLSATYINQIGNTPPTSYLPTASIQLGERYRSPDLSPFQSTLALNYKFTNRLRINPVFTYKKGYPYGTGVVSAFTINGQPYYIPYSDALFFGSFSNVLASCAVNPQNPGTVANPICFATRGIEAASSGPGSLLSKATLNTDLTIEIAPPSRTNGFTYGVAIRNLFDQTAGIPTQNFTQNCQLVVTGLCAQSGPAIVDKTHGPQVVVGDSRGPYVVYPNQPPIAIRFYAQASF